jgi:GNAT superfamily N-acetyltransferase
LPATDPAEWAVHTNHRLLHGFLIDVALIGTRIVGHAEWIVSDEPAPYGRHLYLGMLEVHPDARGRGVGRALVEAGIEKARQLSCPVIKTMSDKAAIGFYRKCGWARTGQVVVGSAALRPVALPKGWVRARTVPRSVVKALPMRLGWAQACSAHMWSLCNRPMRLAGEEPARHPCASRADGTAHVQLRYCPQAGQSALAIAWAPRAMSLRTLRSAAMALASALPVEKVTLMTEADDRQTLASAIGAKVTTSDAEVWSKCLR